MFELRILNGLHRGATLPLDERSLVIGASEDADVVLVDPGIETQHATLTLTDQGWSLSTIDGAVLSADNNRPLASLDLQAGDFARLGHIWLTVTDSEEPWENPPPEPAQNDDFDNIVGADGDPDEQPGLYADTAAEEGEPHSDLPLDAAQNTETAAAVPEEPSAPAPEAAAPAVAPAVAKAAGQGRSNWRRSQTILAPLVLVSILTACAAYTIKSRSHGDSAAKTSDMHSASAPAASQPGKAAAEQPHVQAPKPAPQITQRELREAFRKRLRDVDLLKRFELNLKDDEWTLQGVLDDDEAARFERILAAFIHEHKITFPVRAKIGSAEDMLPFNVREVISGANASIVTGDGNRLYIGDEYRGVRLAAIDGRYLRFDGKRKIKMKW